MVVRPKTYLIAVNVFEMIYVNGGIVAERAWFCSALPWQEVPKATSKLLTALGREFLIAA